MNGSIKGKRALVTGATGLIGAELCKSLAAGGALVTAVVRDEAKARAVPGAGVKTLVVPDITALKAENVGAELIFHCAAPTDSRDFAFRPVEVSRAIVRGTEAALELARVNPVEKFVFLSTMEVYGAPGSDDKIAESAALAPDTSSPRSSYPESKRLAECLCSSYRAEYGVPALSVRLTQTFGPGVKYNDGRVFAEFARCAIEGRDIVLKTKGETKRCYLHLFDAVRALLVTAEKGAPGENYNAADERSYCSIFEMAHMVAEKFGNGIGVRIEERGAEKAGYAPTLKMNLDCSKLRALGWAPEYTLEDAFRDTIEYMKKESADWQRK